MYNRNLFTKYYLFWCSSVALLWSADSTTLRLRSGQARIHSELLKSVFNPKIIANLTRN